jgi:hypothetical protein
MGTQVTKDLSKSKATRCLHIFKNAKHHGRDFYLHNQFFILKPKMHKKGI